MLWPEYWRYQEQHLREQILTAQTKLEGLPPIAAPFQKLQRGARHVLRSYLRQCVRGATGRILLHHPDVLFRSFSIAASCASDFVGLHPVTVQRLARQGDLPGHAVCNGGKRKRWRFLHSELSE